MLKQLSISFTSKLLWIALVWAGNKPGVLNWPFAQVSSFLGNALATKVVTFIQIKNWILTTIQASGAIFSYFFYTCSSFTRYRGQETKGAMQLKILLSFPGTCDIRYFQTN